MMPPNPMHSPAQLRYFLTITNQRSALEKMAVAPESFGSMRKFPYSAAAIPIAIMYAVYITARKYTVPSHPRWTRSEIKP
jgi:hypothetical protein